MGRDHSEDRSYDTDRHRHKYEKKYNSEYRSRRDDRSRRDRDEVPRSERRRRRSSNRDFDDERSQKRGRHSSKDRSSRRDAHDESKKSLEKSSDELDKIPPAQKRTVDLLTSKTGGAYIPPAKLRLMQAEITDKSSPAYQRIAWEALKKSIHGYINKINTSNIGLIIREILRENIIRGQGLLARSIIQAQAASPTFTPVYAALTAVINSKFAAIGELLIKRLVLQFKRGFRRNDKPLCISSGTFIAHLVNQQVVHEILILEILLLLVNNATDDSIEVAIAFLKECGMRLSEVSRKGMESIFEILRNILHEGKLDKRVQYMIEVIFQVRKDGFKDYQAVPEDLDLVEEEHQITHLIELTDPADGKDILNVFKFDPDYVENEEKYQNLIKDILGSESEDEGDGNDDSSAEESSEAEGETKEGDIIDNTETNLTALRRTIYLTINSSLDFEECAHKLMKMQLKPGQEVELCHMFLDCCAEMRTYEKFYGLLAGRFCAINKIYVTLFEQIFSHSYDTIHRLDTNKLRNVSKFFAHLLFTDAISWGVLSNIKLNEQDTTSSGRVFIKILFLELSEYMGLPKLNARVKDPTLTEAFQGLFPVDDPQKTRFSINFFTSIGLGGLTDDLREHLKSRPKPAPLPPVVSSIVNKSSSSSSSSESSSSSSSSSSSDSSDSDSSDSEEERKKRKKRKSKKKQAHKERSTKLKKKVSSDKSDKKSSKKNKKKKKIK